MVLSFLLLSTAFSQILEYRFLSNFGEVFLDYSGNSNHGVNGFLTSTTEGNVAYSDRGIYFTGLSEFVKLPANEVALTNFKLAESFCIEFWIMLVSTNPGFLFLRENSEKNLISVKVVEDLELEVEIQSGEWEKFRNFKEFLKIGMEYIGKWTHFAVGFDLGKFWLYGDSQILDLFRFEYLEINHGSSYLGHFSEKSINGFVSLFSVLASSRVPKLLSQSKSELCVPSGSSCLLPCYPSILIENISSCLSLETEIFKDSKSFKCAGQTSCLNSLDITCENCESKSCEIIENSIKCLPNKSLIKKSSVSNDSLSKNPCLDGYYLNKTPSFQECKKCKSICLTCESEKKCSVCLAYNSYPDDDSCKCNEGFFQLLPFNRKNACFKCHDDCKSCQSSYKCLECKIDDSEPAPDLGCRCKKGFQEIYNELGLLTSCEIARLEEGVRVLGC